MFSSFEVNTEWTKVPQHICIDNCHELVQSRDGRVFLSVDCPENNVLIFGQGGEFLDSWTLGFKGTHGLTLFEDQGEEFLLITHTGVTEIEGVVSKRLGKVVKTNLNGEVLHTFANPFELGLYDEGMTYNPTETCVASNGDIYIADGYGASYVHCFTGVGEYKHSFGGFSEDESSLLNPHGIAIDTRLGDERLVVASRKQSRFKYFSLDGTYIDSIYLPGVYPCRPVIEDDLLYAGVCWSGPVVSDVDLDNYLQRYDDSGFIIIIDKEGKVIEALGAESIEYKNGQLQTLRVRPDSPFHHVHDVLVLPDKSLIVSQWRANQALPFHVTYQARV